MLNIELIRFEAQDVITISGGNNGQIVPPVVDNDPVCTCAGLKHDKDLPHKVLIQVDPNNPDAVAWVDCQCEACHK